MLYIQLGHGSIVHYCGVLTVSILLKVKNLVKSCPGVVFIIVIGLTLLVVSPIWIVLWVFFYYCFTLVRFIFGSRPQTAPCHKYKPALFVFCTTVGKPSQSRSIFQPQPRNIIPRHPLQTGQNTDVPERPIYYSDISELHLGHFPWIWHTSLSFRVTNPMFVLFL